MLITGNFLQLNPIVSDSGHAIHSAWIRRTNLVDSRTSVMDVKFAPKQQGLQLATCSADGVVSSVLQD